MSAELEAIYGEGATFDPDTATVTVPGPVTRPVAAPVVAAIALADPEPVYVDDIGWYGGDSMAVDTVELVGIAVLADGTARPVILDGGAPKLLDTEGTTTNVERIRGFVR